jgi:hypothetical protein
MRDPEFSLTQDELAEIYLNHSGLDQREKKGSSRMPEENGTLIRSEQKS